MVIAATVKPNRNMYGTVLKKFDGLVLHTTDEDGNSDEHDAASLPENHESGSEDGSGCEEDAAATSEDDHGDRDDRGAASEDSDNDDIVPFSGRAVQVLAIRANCHICAINGYNWVQGHCIYREREGEVQEEGMVDLVPIGPRRVFKAYGVFTLEIFYNMTRAANNTASNEGSTPITYPGIPFRVEWDVCGDDDDIEPKEFTETIYCRGCKLETTYLVIPKAIETDVEVKLKLKDLGSRSHAVYGKIKASNADYGNKSVHLFSCERGRSWFVPSDPTSILPLSPAVIALPYRRQLELHIEMDLIVTTISDNQEEYKNLKFSLILNRGIRSQEREVDGDRVEVIITFNPKI